MNDSELIRSIVFNNTLDNNKKIDILKVVLRGIDERLKNIKTTKDNAPKRGFQTWSKTENESLLERFNNSLSYYNYYELVELLAKEFNRTTNSIKAKLYQEGIRVRNGKVVFSDKNEQPSESRKHKKYTKTFLKDVKRLIKQGLTHKQIAKTLNVEPHRIKYASKKISEGGI